MIKVLMATYHRPGFLAATLESLGPALEFTGVGNIQLFIWDNNSCKDVHDLLHSFKDKYKEYIGDIVFSKVNRGKAKALNSFIPNLDDNDAVCSFDSDLIIRSSMFPNPYAFFDCGASAVVDGFITSPSQECSVAVPDQIGNGQHLVEKEWVLDKRDPREERIESEFGYHIAGGCLFTKASTFKAVGGYRENRGLFGGNDGYFLLDASRYTSKPVVLLRRLVVEHPADTDGGYAAWKLKAQDQQRAFQRCLSYKGYFDVKPTTV